MIGNNIKRLRTANGMTQKSLADQLFVSAQAVSRWENDEVEPSLSTIAKMAKIFNVTTDEILGVKDSDEVEEPEKEVIIEKEYVYKEAPKQQLALCERCNHAIYESSDIVRPSDSKYKIVCKKCEAELKKEQQRKEEAEHEEDVRRSKIRRICSFVFGGLSAGAWLIFAIYAISNGYLYGPYGITAGFVLVPCIFTLVSCLILANNFVGEMIAAIAKWSFIRMPGIIFTLDIGGILFFITVKLFLFLLSIVLAILTSILAVILGLIVSVFVYPYAMYKNVKKPEETDF